MSNKPGIVYAFSADIGKINFSFVIECFSSTDLETLSSIPEKKRYNSDGTPTEEMQKVLNQVYENGRILVHENVSLMQGCDKKKKLDPQCFHNMTELLDSYKDKLDLCSLVLIERQMAFGKKINLTAIKLAQHCYSYFTFRYGKTKEIIEFDSYHKTQVLGAPKVQSKTKTGKIRWKAVEKKDRKKWAVDKCLEILDQRGEEDWFYNVAKRAKSDDLADCFLQLQSAKFLMYVEGRKLA